MSVLSIVQTCYDIDCSDQLRLQNFLPNQVVWAKLSGYGYWPGIVLNPVEWDENYFPFKEGKIWILWLGAQCTKMFSDVFVTDVCEFYSNFNKIYKENHVRKTYHNGVNLALKILEEIIDDKIDTLKMKTIDCSNLGEVQVPNDEYHWKRIIPKAVYDQICSKEGEKHLESSNKSEIAETSTSDVVEYAKIKNVKVSEPLPPNVRTVTVNDSERTNSDLVLKEICLKNENLLPKQRTEGKRKKESLSPTIGLLAFADEPTFVQKYSQSNRFPSSVEKRFYSKNEENFKLIGEQKNKKIKVSESLPCVAESTSKKSFRNFSKNAKILSKTIVEHNGLTVEFVEYDVKIVI